MTIPSFPPGFITVTRYDDQGVPHTETFIQPDSDCVTVISMFKNPQPPSDQKRVKVNNLQGAYLNIRTGPSDTYPDVGDAPNGSIYPALELATDVDGNQWVRIDVGKWIVRIYHGIVKAELI